MDPRRLGLSARTGASFICAIGEKGKRARYRDGLILHYAGSTPASRSSIFHTFYLLREQMWEAKGMCG